MTFRIAVAVREDMMDALELAIDGGSGGATLEIRSGTQPADADTTATGTLLATLTLNDPGGVQATGVITIDVSPAITATAVATATATWARLKDSAGATVLDGSVGTSGTDFIIDSTSITSGQTVALVAVSTLTLPAA
ncbi:hypothetical protein [Nocardioides sp. WS12]|uniref:hypothetical protein n=1 Tax=Nocardioides sp. WS12 TaxID=2486272 RepID=UPI0015F7E6DE|nr:hypothetical protein [Nocardioides sp. WS12]